MERCFLIHQQNVVDLIRGDNKVGVTNHKRLGLTIFFCLGNHEQDCVPTRMEKIKLQKAGLGRKRISFHKDSSAAKVKAKLEEIYPRLVSGGGFEILRSGLSPKDLYLITPPPNIGYSVHFLRDSSGLGQAIAYIRPVQADLDSSSLETDDHALAGDAPENKVLYS